MDHRTVQKTGANIYITSVHNYWTKTQSIIEAGIQNSIQFSIAQWFSLPSLKQYN